MRGICQINKWDGNNKDIVPTFWNYDYDFSKLSKDELKIATDLAKTTKVGDINNMFLFKELFKKDKNPQKPSIKEGDGVIYGMLAKFVYTVQ